jgi:protein-disulfide isomerase
VRSGRARLTFRNYPIIGEESEVAAAAALAAAEQDRGWHFVELFYRNQGFENTGYVTAEFLTAVAREAGVPDIGRWDAERRSRRLGARVTWETKQAEKLDLTGTPSFAIQGPRADGLESLGLPGSADELEAAIERAG